MDQKGRKIYFGIFSGITWFALFAFSPYLPTYAESLGADNLQIGIMAGAFGVAQIILRIPMGIFSDRIQSRKTLIILGIVAGLVALTGLWLTQSIILFIVMRVLVGITASSWLFYIVMFSSYYPPGDLTKAQGIIMASSYIGQGLSFVAAAFVASAYGIRSIFMLCIVFFAVSLVMSFFIKETNNVPIPKYSLGDVFKITKDKWITKVSVIGFIEYMFIFGAIFGFTPKLATTIGANEFDLAILSVIFTITSILASFACGTAFLKRFDDKNVLTFSTSLFVVACLLQPLCRTMAEMYFLQAFAGIARGMSLPVLGALLLKYTPLPKYAVVTGYFQSVHSIGVLLGPIIIGSISQMTSMLTAYSALAAVGVLMPLISHYGLKNQKQ